MWTHTHEEQSGTYFFTTKQVEAGSILDLSVKPFKRVCHAIIIESNNILQRFCLYSCHIILKGQVALWSHHIKMVRSRYCHNLSMR